MPGNDLTTLVQAQKSSLAALLANHPSLTPEKMVQLLMSATKASWFLGQVARPDTGHPETLVAALLQAAAVGLEPNTPLQHCALIPRKAKDGKWTANFQLMFRGRMHLAVVHGGIVDWQGEAVYKQDRFIYRPSSRTEPIIHEPELDSTKRPADLRGAYVIITLPSGALHAKWMPIAEIMSIAERYSDSYKAYLKDKSKDDSPWVQRPGEQAIKTVANNIYKQIVLTSPPPVQIGGQLWERGPAAAAALVEDDETEEIEDERAHAAPKQTDRPVAVGNVPDNQGPTRRSEPAGLPSQSSAQSASTDGGGKQEPPPAPTASAPQDGGGVTEEDADGMIRAVREADGDSPATGDEQDDREIGKVEGEQLRQRMIKAGMRADAQRVILREFDAISFENIKGWQKPMIEAAIEARGAK